VGLSGALSCFVCPALILNTEWSANLAYRFAHSCRLKLAPGRGSGTGSNFMKPGLFKAQPKLGLSGRTWPHFIFRFGGQKLPDMYTYVNWDLQNTYKTVVKAAAIYYQQISTTTLIRVSQSHTRLDRSFRLTSFIPRHLVMGGFKIRNLTGRNVEVFVSKYTHKDGSDSWFAVPPSFNDASKCHWNRNGWELIAFREAEKHSVRRGWYVDCGAGQVDITFVGFSQDIGINRH